jgi:hypothetical protein
MIAPDSRLATEREVFSDVAAFSTVFARVNGRPVKKALVTGNYFSMLGVGAAVGRTLDPADTTAPGQEAVIAIRHSTWRSRFGEAADVRRGARADIVPSRRLHDSPNRVHNHLWLVNLHNVTGLWRDHQTSSF